MNTDLIEYLQKNTKSVFNLVIGFLENLLVLQVTYKLLFLITNTGKSVMNILCS